MIKKHAILLFNYKSVFDFPVIWFRENHVGPHKVPVFIILKIYQNFNAKHIRCTLLRHPLQVCQCFLPSKASCQLEKYLVCIICPSQRYFLIFQKFGQRGYFFEIQVASFKVVQSKFFGMGDFCKSLKVNCRHDRDTEESNKSITFPFQVKPIIGLRARQHKKRSVSRTKFFLLNSQGQHFGKNFFSAKKGEIPVIVSVYSIYFLCNKLEELS